ncbi:hypothetical protein CBS147337_10097 [Penicillium roqueforti]|nr:hypothetical protein CBS147337_10097 [Penicillium roqueforti]
MFADSQAALKALRRPRMPSGQVYLVGCLDLTRQLANKGIRTELRWIPAHQGVAGNEIADGHAKKAAQGPEEPLNSFNRYSCAQDESDWAPISLALTDESRHSVTANWATRRWLMSCWSARSTKRSGTGYGAPCQSRA